MAAFDRSSKWLIQHHGDAILRLAGIRNVVSWRPLQAELVQPRQLPDGLLEAQLQGETEPDLFVVEIATYPEQRLHDQLARDAMLVFLSSRFVPEVVALVLHPKGKLRPAASVEYRSRRGLGRIAVDWRVIELWTVPAEELLKTRDPGLVPWVPLTQFDDPPTAVFQRCREIIEQEANPEEQESLLAVTQILAGLRYNDPQVFQLLGGRDAMIESPLLQEIVSEAEARGRIEAEHDSLLRFLRARFGALPDSLQAEVQSTIDPERLHLMIDWAGRCPDLDSFARQLREVN